MPSRSLNQHVLAVCAARLHHGSKSFHAASRLLPSSNRIAATALYAFCRMADDAIDIEGKSPAELRHRVALAAVGTPLETPEDQALAWVLDRYQIPGALLEALLEGFEWDVAGRQYTTINDVYAYAARVASTVGAMMALVMGARDPQSLARACDLGVAMQLTNIARDVGEDARAGRVYLPSQWLEQEGVPSDSLGLDPYFTPQLGRVVSRLLDAAEKLYGQADSGLASLPRTARPSMFAARYLYAAIGSQVRANRCDSISQRAVVDRATKLKNLGVALRASVVAMPSRRSVPALNETHFLVKAVEAHPLVIRNKAPIGEQLGWLFDVCIRMEVEDRERRQGHAVQKVGLSTDLQDA